MDVCGWLFTRQYSSIQLYCCYTENIVNRIHVGYVYCGLVVILGIKCIQVRLDIAKQKAVKWKCMFVYLVQGELPPSLVVLSMLVNIEQPSAYCIYCSSKTRPTSTMYIGCTCVLEYQRYLHVYITRLVLYTGILIINATSNSPNNALWY